MAAKFDGGIEIAMKRPPHQYHAIVAFYRDVRCQTLWDFREALVAAKVAHSPQVLDEGSAWRIRLLGTVAILSIPQHCYLSGNRHASRTATWSRP
ncbi:hypothetical protein [Pelagibacterium lentulum]|uniref:hypothetical protein n=1 Tax=Pelagibacterium lentulum TaxID=2029865 RepID=UPI000F8D8732|nr:hypothetical protein [Pelagibacterium lentulum]